MIILIVDDDESKILKIEIVISEILSSKDVIVLKAYNSYEATRILLEIKELDLLIIDLNLPTRPNESPKKNGGLMLLKEIIRRDELFKANNIIGLTAHEDIKNLSNGYFNKEGWVIATYNPKKTDWEETIKNKIDYIKKTKKMNIENIKSLPTIVILTAIKEEYMAIRAHLTEIKDNDVKDTSYEMGIFFCNNKKVANVIIRECGAKNANSSQETERAIQYFSPDCIFFVGIAGSRKPNDFKIGDVIFPSKIYSYEGGKALKSSFNARPDLESLTFALLEKAKKERLKDDWKNLIRGKYEIEPKADIGVIASGDILIENYNSEIGNIITTHYNDTSAVEMEGFGFVQAASRQGRESSHITFGVVRGISDILENLDVNVNDKRPSHAKLIASDTAAAFAFWLIYKYYE